MKTNERLEVLRREERDVLAAQREAHCRQHRTGRSVAMALLLSGFAASISPASAAFKDPTRMDDDARVVEWVETDRIAGTNEVKADDSARNQGDADDSVARNQRDADDSALTPMDQSSKPRDIALTQKIRKDVVADESLSMLAHNVKIISIDGVVTLRGPVESVTEKKRVAALAEKAAGSGKVRNDLEIAAD